MEASRDALAGLPRFGFSIWLASAAVVMSRLRLLRPDRLALLRDLDDVCLHNANLIASPQTKKSLRLAYRIEMCDESGVVTDWPLWLTEQGLRCVGVRSSYDAFGN
jgi:hypothetical protein